MASAGWREFRRQCALTRSSPNVCFWENLSFQLWDTWLPQATFAGGSHIPRCTKRMPHHGSIGSYHRLHLAHSTHVWNKCRCPRIAVCWGCRNRSAWQEFQRHTIEGNNGLRKVRQDDGRQCRSARSSERTLRRCRDENLGRKRIRRLQPARWTAHFLSPVQCLEDVRAVLKLLEKNLDLLVTSKQLSTASSKQ